MCLYSNWHTTLPRATCGCRLADQYFCSMPHVYVVGLTHLPIHTLCVWVAGIGSNTHAMYLLLIFGRVHSTDLYLCYYTHNNIGNTSEGRHMLGSMGREGGGLGLRETFRACLLYLSYGVLVTTNTKLKPNISSKLFSIWTTHPPNHLAQGTLTVISKLPYY